MEPKEGDIAEDGNGNFLLFRGGQWYPANEQGRPLQRIPRPDYGANFFELPNGDIVRQGPRGGMEVIESAGGGPSGQVSADQRGRYNIGAGPLATAERNLAVEEARGNPLNRDWGAVLLDSIDLNPGEGQTRPFAPLARMVGGQDYQNMQQALSTYEASLLPIQSGANVTATEAARQIRADFPALGDSPETLRRKAANRMMRINAIQQGIGRPPEFTEEEIANPDIRAAMPSSGVDVVGPIGPNGLPTYPTITERTANIRDIKTPGEGIAVQWLVDNGVDTERFQNDTDYAQAEMSRLGYEPINGEWVNKYGQTAPIDKSKPPASESIAPVSTSDQGAIDQRRSESGLARRVDAFVRGAADTATFGLADEISAGLNTVLPLDRGSVGGWGQGFGPAYEQNLALARGIDRADAEQMPITRGAGQVAGAIGGGVGAARLAPQALRIAPRVAGATRMANAGRIAANTGRVAAGGAATGGAYGFGSSEGGVQDRAGNALEGAAIGAVAAPVAGAVGNALARPVGRLVERVVSRPNALTTGVDRFARRFNPNTNALAARADELSAMEIQPTFVDLMDEGQRGLTRALATRQTPARQAVRDFAEGRAEGLQDRIATQARRTISPETRSPLELREMAARQAREQAAPLYEQAYAQPVQVSDEIKSLLATPAGQAALGRAQRIAANERRPFDIENMDMQTLDYAKRGLDDVLEGYRDPVTGRLNLDTEGRAVEAVRQAFRTELDNLNPAYAAARQAYGDSASLQGATDLGEQFLTMEADQFARQAGRLNPAERMVAQAGARRAVERAAGTQGAAPGVAQRLASGREQGMRSQALLGENAGAMQQAMQAEREGLMAARSINPAQGSVTASAMSDQMQTLGNVGQTIGSALTGNLRGTVGGLARLVRLGYSDKEAEALVTAAIDPTRTREVIDLLAARMSRGEARNLVRSLRYMAGQQSGAQAARSDQ